MRVDALIDQLNTGVYEQPSDNIKSVNRKVIGFSAPCLMAVLSLAVSHMEDDELYLEIGTHYGRTLIGAMVDNPTKRAVAVDNFSEFASDTIETDLHNNLVRFGISNRVTFFNEDCQHFLSRRTEYHDRVGVFFYDGNHNTDQGYVALFNAISFLRRNSVIVIDDISGEGIWATLALFIKDFWPQTRMLFFMSTTNWPFPNARWHNGVAVLEWRGDE